jgi:N-acetyl-gamma-glutamyl-phosphate/LysW-gamma-L-alpha-aminoadipyl-6-phosphate reductase
MPPERKRVAIVGASGFAGGEFLRLALAHPQLEVTQVTSERRAGEPVVLTHPHLRSLTNLRFRRIDELEPSDILVSALPHGALASRSEQLLPLAEWFVDLSADFRLRDPERYQRTYGSPHPHPELLSSFVYANPELDRAQSGNPALPTAKRIAGAGCAATASILALLPLVRGGVLARREVIIEAKVGSSAAGAEPSAASHHPLRSGAMRTYQPVGHRHEAEIAQAFPGLTAHLTATATPRVRGILVTVHAFLHDGSSERDVRAAIEQVYADEPFVRFVNARRGIHRVPDPRVLDGSNFFDIGFALDPQSSRLVMIGAIDNLVKGTAGHALQSLNIALGFDERAGLGFAGLYP